MIPSLTGLAFTSPGVAVLAIDREKFRVHIYQPSKLASLHLFTQSTDKRKPIVFVSSVFDLLQILHTDNIYGFLLFDDVVNMQKIENIKILDIEGTKSDIGWTKISVTPDTLNEALNRKEEKPFVIKDDLFNLEQELTGEITFRDLVINIVKVLSRQPGQEELATSFLENVCLYTVGIITKRMWNTRVKKPLLGVGINVELLVELEKWFDTSAAKNLWKAYYQHAEKKKSIESASKELKSNENDLRYIVDIIGAEKGQKYASYPKK